MSERLGGVVKWFSNEKGYGFINQDDDENTDYFVHFSSISMEGYKTLQAKQRVSFILEDTDRGVQAKEVTLE